MKKLLTLLGISATCAMLFACGLSPSGSSGTGNGGNEQGSGGNSQGTGGNEQGSGGNGHTPGGNEQVGDQQGDVEIKFATGAGAFMDGETSATVKTNADGSVTFGRLPVRDGYAFDGWYNGDVEYSESAQYTSAQTFTARYVSGADELVYSALFDENSTVSVHINMSDAEWKKLDADVGAYRKSPIYRMADYVTIGIEADGKSHTYYYEEVGVRMKGNTSRHVFYSNNGFYNSIHMKLSFKQTFDDVDDGYKQNELKDWSGKDAERKARKNRLLGGMEKIDVKYNSTLDDTYIRELYAMRLFNRNGVVAPKITLCSLSALEKNTSTRNLGVYRIHESIDEQFLIHNGLDVDGEVGDLWKCTWGDSWNGADLNIDDFERNVGVEDELKNEFYAYDKKTNKKKDKTTGKRDLESIKTFIRAINGDDVDFDRYIDTAQFAKFEAVNFLLGNPDCIRNHANNYYIYFRKTDGKAIIIPYDYDRCLGSRQWDNYEGMSHSYITPFTRRTTLDGGLRNPLYTKLIVKGAPYGEGSVLQAYRSNLLSLIDSQDVKAQAFNALKAKYKAKYSSFTSSALGGAAGNNLAWDNKVTFDGGVQNMDYGDYINAKSTVIRENKDNYID